MNWHMVIMFDYLLGLIFIVDFRPMWLKKKKKKKFQLKTINFIKMIIKTCSCKWGGFFLVPP
jgi:hypothetical protein